MAIDFPDSPTVDQQYSVGDRTWTWNGTYWQLSQTSSTFTASDTAPVSPSAGDIWFESDTGQTFVYYDQSWVEIGAATDLSDILSDADADTSIQVEASSDEDVIRFRTAGTERLQLTSDGHLIPQANVTYDLGSASNRFRDLYLSGSSIDLGGVEITSDGTSLTMPPVSNISGDFTVGTDVLHVDHANSRVGIGTASPGVPFDVEGLGRFVSPNIGSTGAVIIRQPSGDAAGGFLQWVDNSNLNQKGTIYAGPTGDMAIRPSGGSLTVQESYLDVSLSSNTTGTSTGTTLQKLSNYVGSDLSQQKTFIDFIFTDDNSNNYPQVRIGAEVGQNGDANSQEKEGSGAFVVYTNNATTTTDGSPSDLSERLRVSYHGRTGLGSTNPGAHLELKAADASMDGRLHLNRYTGTAASPGEPMDWPMPTLALRAYDNFYKITMLSIGYSNDAIYQTGNSVWNMRLAGAYGSTSSSSSTHLEFYGPGTLKTGNFTASGTKTFTIAHPLPEMKDTHDLVHSSVEAPQADNLYRGRAVLVDGMATINLDEEAGMTEGTFVLLNRDVQCYVSNENGWTALRGYVDGNILTIEAEDSSCVDNISWLVIGERQDDDMMSSHRTDDDGRLIVEPLTDRQSEDEFNAEVARLEAKRAAEEQVAEEVV